MVRAFALLFGVLIAVGSAVAAEPAMADTDLWRLGGGKMSWNDVLSGDRTKAVVFTTLWCAVCRRQEPAVERWAADHGSRTRTIVVVSGSDPESVAEAATRRHWAAPLEVMVDPRGELAAAFGVQGTPTLFLLDADGATLGRFHRIAELAAAAEPSLEATRVVVRDDGEELGTTYDVSVTVPADRDRADVERDLSSARERCREFGAQLSEWSDSSEVSRVNREAASGPVPLSDTLRRILEGAGQVTRVTGGAFDLTWKSLEPLWDDAAARDTLPTADEIATAREAVGEDHVVVEGKTVRFTHPSTRIGVAGVAKGWIIDAVFLHLRYLGYENIIVNIGGDLRASGVGADGAPLRIDIVDPYRPGSRAGDLEIGDTAVATSGNYLRTRRIAGREIGHILDPRTGWPPDFEGSVTVLAPDAAMADALATALFVLGPDAGLELVRQLDGVEAVYATRDGLRSSLTEAGAGG